jgi:restriction endonuclease S subunit
LDKSLTKQSNDIAFFKVDNDGFDLGDQRREIDKNDLPHVKVELEEFLFKIRSHKPTSELKLSRGLIVSKEKIGSDGNYNLNGERYKAGKVTNSNYQLVPIGDLCELFNGRAFKPEDWKKEGSGGIPIIRIQNLNNADSKFNYFTGKVSEKNKIKEGELLFSWSGSRGTSFGAHIWHGGDAVLNQHIFKLGFDQSRATKMYLLHALNRAVTEVEENLHGGVGLVHITKGNFERIKIPLPSLDIQKEIVEEIECYQRVIDGAQAVLKNYRPHIPIDPTWPMMELGDIIEGKPKNGYSGKPVSHQTKLKVLSLSATTSGTMDTSKFKYLDEDIPIGSPCRCRKDDIYLQRGNTKELVGTAALFGEDSPNFIYPDLMIRVRADKRKILTQFLLYTLQSEPVRDFVKRNAIGAAGSMPKINQGIVEKIPIPLPALETQQQIVAEIEAEQALVSANRELIERFEKKIQDTIDLIWGEDSLTKNNHKSGN